MKRHVILLLLGLLAADAALLYGANREEVGSLLGRPILEKGQPTLEVRRYCDARVKRMPEIQSAAQWEAEALRLRKEMLEKIVYRGQAAAWRDAETRIEWLETVAGGPGYRIKKLRYEALPGMWIPALLYEPENLAGKVPAVMNVNGHSSEGKRYKPKQMRCINQAKKGILALNLEWLHMGQLRTDGFSHYRMNQLDLCGTSGLAPFYLCMKRGLDVLLSLENTDPERVAVTGLSGGGWQTVVISSLDTRVKLSTPVAGYSSFRTRAWHGKDLGDSEQTPSDMATVADYAHLTAMIAPRPLLLIYNSKDNCCFESGYVLPTLLDAVLPVYRALGRPHAVRWHVNDTPGTHNYEQDNREAFYRMLRDFFYEGDKTFDAKEIPCKDEIKTAEELFVKLPSPNQDFHTLAMTLMKDLPLHQNGRLPNDEAAARKWQKTARAKLRRIVRARDYQVQTTIAGEDEKEGVRATFWKLAIGDDWTVPVVELVPMVEKPGEKPSEKPAGPEKTAILVADAGRAGAVADAVRLLDSGHRVLAVDVFLLGRSKPEKRSGLYAILVAAVGDRPLGVQASQLVAAARWSADRHKTGPVLLVARGARSCTSALVAAGLEQEAIGGVELHDALGSLKQVIEQNRTVMEQPELFCFGLLEAFDIKQLAALVAPRPVTFVDATDRVKTEMAELGAWYDVLDTNSIGEGDMPCPR